MEKIKAIEDEARGRERAFVCSTRRRSPTNARPFPPSSSRLRVQMARTQKNKATSYHLGTLKAKLAKLRRELLEPSKGAAGAGKGEGFDVTKVGDSRVGLVGFPSVGKSTLLTKLTGTFSEAASYEFTTLTCIPGVIRYRGAKIQLLDLPGIIEGAKDGKGRGRQVISTARTCNLILIVLVRLPHHLELHPCVLVADCLVSRPPPPLHLPGCVEAHHTQATD